MNSRTRMKKMVCHVVNNAVPAKQLISKSRSKSMDENSLLITPDQPLSHDQLINNNHNRHIPKGFVAVYVGPHHRRFLVPTRYLSVPDFKAVMDSAAEEFGYEQQGRLEFPNCKEDEFQELLAHCCRYTSIPKSKSYSYIHMIIPLQIHQ
ncbi:hypothetical protein ACP275_09G146400 [Erythranthe tilingii]